MPHHVLMQNNPRDVTGCGSVCASMHNTLIAKLKLETMTNAILLQDWKNDNCEGKRNSNDIDNAHSPFIDGTIHSVLSHCKNFQTPQRGFEERKLRLQLSPQWMFVL